MIYMSKQIPKQLLLLFFCFIRPLKSKVLIPCDIKGLWILLPFYFSLRKITEKVKTKSSRKNILQMKKIERERERERERWRECFIVGKREQGQSALSSLWMGGTFRGMGGVTRCRELPSYLGIKQLHHILF